MGGSAFAANGLLTPRMPPTVYRRVLQQVIGLLKSVYIQVEEPLEAPGKADYGDVDILVVSREPRPSPTQIARLLGAAQFKGSGSGTAHYALPWPGEPSAGIDNKTSEAHERLRDPVSNSPMHYPRDNATAGKGQKQKYVQVDVNHNSNADELLFTKFLHAHGDFWLIVGGMIRPLGLTCTDGGLYIRIAELEQSDRKRARIKIIESPDEILRYLGFDVERFWQPFKSAEACMDFATTCRFFDPQRGQDHTEDSSSARIKAEEKKYNQRPMFAYWLDHYLPAHRETAAGRSASMTREDVVHEAKIMLGHEFTERYELQKSQGMREFNEKTLWADVKAQIPADGARLTYALKGLKSMASGSSDKIESASIKDLRDVRNAYQEMNFEAVKDWALLQWEAAADWQETWNKQQSHTHLMQRLERQSAEAGDTKKQSHEDDKVEPT